MSRSGHTTMQRTDRILVEDEAMGAALISRWLLSSEALQREAAETALRMMPQAQGLLRYSVFRGVDDHALAHYSQWTDRKARDRWVAHPVAKEAVDRALPSIDRRWRVIGTHQRSVRSDACAPCGALVVVHQPLRTRNVDDVVGLIDAVIDTLKAVPPSGLSASHFFAADDASAFVNIAEWTSAQAHRAWLGSRERTQGASWVQLLQRPELRAKDASVDRYELFGSVEPAPPPTVD